MNKGFSLIESLIAISITLGVGLSVFQLFLQNERAFRDHEIVAELQQTARVAGFQIADEIRLAGQGVPVFSASFDESPTESTAVILAGSDSSRINFRAGLSNVESEVTSGVPIGLIQNAPTILTVRDASLFSGTGGRHAYLWGPVAPDIWGWIRATVGTVGVSTQSIQVTALQTIQFAGFPILSLDEAVAIYWDGATNSIRRTTATDMTTPMNPTWAPANELATNVTALTFTYYDARNGVVTPNSLANRNSVRRVDVNLNVQASAELSSGERPNFLLHLRSIPRNLRSQ